LLISAIEHAVLRGTQMRVVAVSTLKERLGVTAIDFVAADPGSDLRVEVTGGSEELQSLVALEDALDRLRELAMS
jgi:hypothetical protein